MKVMKYAGVKVLLLDDKATNCLLIENILKESLDEVIIKTARSEKEFQKQVIRFNPDVILSNYTLQEYSVSKALDWLEEENKNKPLILVSDQVSEVLAKELISRGVEDFIPKSQLGQLPIAVLKAFDKGKIKNAKTQAESKLKISEERLETFFKYAPEAIINLGFDGKILEINPAGIKKLSIKSFEKLRNKYIWDHIVKADIKILRKAVQSTGRGHHETVQFRVDSGYNRIVWFESNLVPILDEEEAVCSVLTISRDITNQKNALEELNYQAALINNIVDAVITVNEKFEIKAWNKGAEKLYGFTENEAKGRVINELIKVQYEHNNRDEVINVLQKTGHATGENIGFTKTGEAKNILFSVSHLQTQTGEMYVGIYRDITQQVNARQKLKESEQKFLKVFQSNPAGIAINRIADKKFVDVNDRFLAMMGYTRDEFIGFSTEELGLVTDAEVSKKMNQQLLQNGFFRDIELTLRKKTGELIHVFASTDTVSIGGKAHTITIVYDITEQKKAQEKINHLATITKNISDPVISTDEKFLIRSWNRGAEKMYGFTAEEAVGKSMGDLIHFDFAKSRDKLIEDLLKQGYLQGEVALKTLTGDRKYISYRVSSITNDRNEITGYVALHRDLTLQRITQRKLHDVQNRVAATMESLSAMIWSVDTDFKLTYCNMAFENLMRRVYQLDVKNGMSLEERVPAKLFSQRYEKQKENYTRALNGETVSHQDNHEEDGIIKYNIVTYYPITEFDKVMSIVCISKDITEIKNTQEQIAKSELQFRTLSDHSPVGIFLSDYKGNLEYVNKKFSELTGVQSEDAKGHVYLDAMHPDDRERIRIESAEFRASGRDSQRYEMRFLKPDGKITWAIVQSNALRKKSGMVYGFVGTVTDITEKVEKENLIMEKKRRLKLAQALAHIGDWTYDPVKQTGEWSDEMFRIFEVDPNVPLLQYIEFIELVHPEDRKNVLEANEKTFKEKTTNKLTYHVTTPAGNEKFIISHVTFVSASHGFPDRLSGTAQDITECTKNLAHTKS